MDYFIAIVVLVSIYWVYMETNRLDIVEVELSIAKQLPVSGFRIALLSDLHGKTSLSGIIMTALAGTRLDMIAVTGDLVEKHAHELDGLEPLFRGLVSIAPTFVVSGNHDQSAGWPEMRQTLAGFGAIVLDNAHHFVQKAGHSMCVVGIADLATGRGDLRKALPESNEVPLILLSHSPALFSSTRVNKRFTQLLSTVDLTLCGHTHGGQIKLPLLGAVTAASGAIFPRKYVQGLHREGEGWLYINRGIGCTGFPRLRFLSRPELTLITLRTQRKSPKRH